MALSAQAQQTAGNQRCPSGEVCPREAKNMTSCPLQIAALSRRHEKRGEVRAGECMSGGLGKPGLPVLAQPCGRQLELLGPTEREREPAMLLGQGDEDPKGATFSSRKASRALFGQKVVSRGIKQEQGKRPLSNVWG